MTDKIIKFLSKDSNSIYEVGSQEHKMEFLQNLILASKTDKFIDNELLNKLYTSYLIGDTSHIDLSFFETPKLDPYRYQKKYIANNREKINAKRHSLPKKHCDICNVDISRPVWSRHLKSKNHELLTLKKQIKNSTTNEVIEFVNNIAQNLL